MVEAGRNRSCATELCDRHRWRMIGWAVVAELSGPVRAPANDHAIGFENACVASTRCNLDCVRDPKDCHGRRACGAVASTKLTLGTLTPAADGVIALLRTGMVETGSNGTDCKRSLDRGRCQGVGDKGITGVIHTFIFVAPAHDGSPIFDRTTVRIPRHDLFDIVETDDCIGNKAVVPGVVSKLAEDVAPPACNATGTSNCAAMPSACADGMNVSLNFFEHGFHVPVRAHLDGAT